MKRILDVESIDELKDFAETSAQQGARYCGLGGWSLDVSRLMNLNELRIRP
ncbi:hypothetical protein NJH78_02660 [Pseudomonas chlororaphis]|uniref:hypothetical protein n=1 Tax=Pseudomonas chlororaphis TaxID=587753 RepID=UPI00209BB4F2|nr:hypothetical protein [Pseudomonas chlororaphis]MCO7568864.1 hypothetical protein [Pseudomonas chlororaphis]MCO7590885.1 hypothetical protein [Pseudomonas chlororaphis]